MSVSELEVLAWHLVRSVLASRAQPTSPSQPCDPQPSSSTTGGSARSPLSHVTDAAGKLPKAKRKRLPGLSEQVTGHPGRVAAPDNHVADSLTEAIPPFWIEIPTSRQVPPSDRAPQPSPGKAVPRRGRRPKLPAVRLATTTSPESTLHRLSRPVIVPDDPPQSAEVCQVPIPRDHHIPQDPESIRHALGTAKAKRLRAGHATTHSRSRRSEPGDTVGLSLGTNGAPREGATEQVTTATPFALAMRGAPSGDEALSFHQRPLTTKVTPAGRSTRRKAGTGTSAGPSTRPRLSDADVLLFHQQSLLNVLQSPPTRAVSPSSSAAVSDILPTSPLSEFSFMVASTPPPPSSPPARPALGLSPMQPRYPVVGGVRAKPDNLSAAPRPKRVGDIPEAPGAISGSSAAAPRWRTANTR